ncbi:MAG: hypothetical protein ACKOA9_08845 [Actinomycetota bacterium]
MERWILAAVWATLPATAGGALADATAEWSTAPQVVAAALLWAAWGIALLGIVLPRPVGLTVVRAVAPCFLLLAVVVAGWSDASATAGAVAVAATLVAQVLVARPPLALLAVNALAYGDESRFPLRVPPGLFLGPLPLARLLLGVAVATGPLLLADARWVAGAVASVVAVPVAVVAARSVHGLSRRWAVLVPAGFVVVDPLTLTDPVLFPRERIVTLGRLGAAPPAGDDVLDLRLGASLGAVTLTVDRPAELFRARRRRRDAQTVTATRICVASVAADLLLDEAARRHIPVVSAGAS